MYMSTVILGSSGYLGQAFLGRFPDAKTPSLDIADVSEVRPMLDGLSPQIVINCAGKTGRPNIDWCEDHKEETLHANVIGPLLLAEECSKRGIQLVHLSSGCIYEGDNGGTGFTEDDEPNFTGSYYSRTKALCDKLLVEFPVLILRLRMPFDGSDSPRSLINKVSKFDRVNEVQNSVTYIPDFIDAADSLIKKKATGIYNIVNPGPTSPYSIMCLYKEIVDPSKEFERLPLENLDSVSVARRSNCILSIAKLEAEGISMKPVDEAVTEALEQILHRFKQRDTVVTA